MEEIILELPSGQVQAVAHGHAGRPLVLCLHGLSANARAFDFLGERLAGEGRRAVALDLRGRGLSADTAPGTYGLGAHAADVLAAANALGAEVFDLVGWSMGALIGILSAVTAVGRLRRLVLLDHAGRMDPEAVVGVRAGLARLDAVVADPQDHVDAVRAAGGVARWVPQWDAVFRRELERRPDGAWSARTSRRACEEDLEDMIAREWPPAWHALAMPTLLVRGTIASHGGGFIVPESERDGLAAVARSLTVVEVAAGHYDVMTDEATWSAVATHLA